jgi:hypothetical protein
LANVVISFHVFTISAGSRSDATGLCEYLFHGCTSGYSVVINFRTDRSATLLFNFKTSEFKPLSAVEQTKAFADSLTAVRVRSHAPRTPPR